MPAQPYVIVGGGLAGAKAAEELRSRGFDGRLVLIGAETERPYERPPLSKDYLRGESGRGAIYVHDRAFYAEQDIDLRLGRTAVRLDPDTRELALDDGARIRYDRLLIATGAEPRRLDVPGADLPGVMDLRDVRDADALRERLGKASSLVIVGAGWIGAEVAASARQLGLEVTIVAPDAVPLRRVLGAELGAFYRDVHADHGVRLLLRTGVEAFEGERAVERVRTTRGAVHCDLVVVGIGVVPRTRLAEQAGLAIENGILVDVRLRTSAPGVFAAGDVVNAHHPFYGRRVRAEHWANALHQGPAAARTMLGQARVYDHLPYFFSDQYDVGMEYSGLARPTDRLVLRGDPAEREFIAFWLDEGCVVAAMNVNVFDVADPIRRLIEQRVVVDERRLVDPDVPLDALVPAARVGAA
jgi:3-phenylpropionate/trans-cinnamate dioxygenase ferredoxin reductase subunit